MIEYFISKHGDDGTYHVAKFDGGDESVAVYTVKGKKCDCLAGTHRGKCKHIAMVAAWQPGFYFEGAGTVIMLPLPDSFDHEPEGI